MPMKKESHTEVIVANILEQMRGERWEHLRLKLKTKGLRALIAETTLEESKIIQEKVTKSFGEMKPRHERIPLIIRLQNAMRKGIEQSTVLPWPALNQETFDT